MRDHDYQDSIAFVTGIFGDVDGLVELRAIPNVYGDSGTEFIFVNNDMTIQSFCGRKDVAGMAIYFGLCTRKPGTKSAGGKADVFRCPHLWVDIDCAKQGISGDEALRALSFLPYPPTTIINSGGGLHAYWRLEEALDVSEGQYAAVEAALRHLVHILAGDPACADIARILRLPGTINSKDATRALNDGEPVLCEVLEHGGAVYDFQELCEWLNEQRPVLHAVRTEATRPVREDDPFVAYARAAGFNPAIVIDDELAAMEHGGQGDRSIHSTQLRVSMSMIARGYEDDEIVSTILGATERAAPRDKKWNWTAEEKAIRKMISTGRDKAKNREKTLISSVPPRTQSNAALGNTAVKVVHDLAEEKAKRQPKVEVDEKSKTAQLGEAVIGVWKERYGPIIHTAGTTYSYRAGIWEEWNDRLEQRLRSMIQDAFASLKVDPKTSILNAVYRYVMERPSLQYDEVQFDRHGLIIAEDGVLDPLTLERAPHSPDHYALFKVAASFEGDRTTPGWANFLRGSFGDINDAEMVISTLQEWFGSALVTNKARPLKKGLLAHGPSRTGKTQIAGVARGLLGGKHTSGAKMRDLEGRFGMEPFVGKRGWIADDAVGEAEFLDAETYKVVVTGEPVSVQRKGGKNLETRFGFPVLLTANNLPRVKDQSDAVFNRSLILRMTKVRDEAAPEPVGYESISAKIVAEELTGVLWWAIEGWQRLSARGYYQPPACMLEANQEFQDDNNPVGAWIKQCIELSDREMVSRIDLAASFNGWRTLEHEDDRPWKNNTITRRISKILPGHKTHKQHGERMLTGIRLNEDGLFAWQRIKDNAGFEKKVTFSNDKAEVNRFWEPETIVPPTIGEAVQNDRKPRF